MEGLDFLEYNFNENNVLILNIAVGFIMFGVALGLRIDDFKTVIQQPKQIFAGLLSQLLFLPILTIIIIHIFEPQASVALGMILISVCPGGNISNFMSSLAKANVALSVSLTAITSTVAVFFTPIGLAWWGSMYEPAHDILTSIELNYIDVLITVFLIIVVPLVIGMYVRSKYEKFALRVEQIMKNLSILIFLGIVIFAVISNLDPFIKYMPDVAGLVILHNLVAISIGYVTAKVFSLHKSSVKTLMIETGIQNSGLGLALIFTFFGGLGGMTLVAAGWGVWHIISGLLLSKFLSKR